MNDCVNFSDLLGKTLVRVEPRDDKTELLIVTDTGEVFKQYHCQDCCESVSIEEIVGDISDLIGSPILLAEEVCSSEDKPDDPAWRAGEYEESYTWTFYKMATIKGSVTIRWFGASNGYYSESVDFVRAA